MLSSRLIFASLSEILVEGCCHLVQYWRSKFCLIVHLIDKLVDRRGTNPLTSSTASTHTRRVAGNNVRGLKGGHAAYPLNCFFAFPFHTMGRQAYLTRLALVSLSPYERKPPKAHNYDRDDQPSNQASRTTKPPIDSSPSLRRMDSATVHHHLRAMHTDNSTTIGETPSILAREITAGGFERHRTTCLLRLE